MVNRPAGLLGASYLVTIATMLGAVVWPDRFTVPAFCLFGQMALTAYLGSRYGV